MEMGVGRASYVRGKQSFIRTRSQRNDHLILYILMGIEDLL